MNKYVLFLQGGGDGGYEADKDLFNALQKGLGKGYYVHYPELKIDKAAPDFGWMDQIAEQISKAKPNFILVAHSFGASMVLKYLSQQAVPKKTDGIFLLATPYWSGDENWKQGFKLPENFADHLPANTPLFFYQCRDDEETPFAHFEAYKHRLPRATFREMESGGHQFTQGLSVVTDDIKSLYV